MGLPWAHTSPGAPTSPRATGPTEARQEIFKKNKFSKKKLKKIDFFRGRKPAQKDKRLYPNSSPRSGEKFEKNKNLKILTIFFHIFLRAVYQLKKTSDCIQIHPPGPGQNLKKNIFFPKISTKFFRGQKSLVKHNVISKKY